MTTSNDFYEVNNPVLTYKANNSHIISVARIAIPVLLSFYTPVKQGVVNIVEDSEGYIVDSTLNLGTYVNSKIETSDFGMTETKQTIENTKDIEYISKTLDEIKDVLKTLPRKVDIENLELKIDVAIKNNTINNYKLIAGVLFTSIIAPLALLIIQHYFFN